MSSSLDDLDDWETDEQTQLDRVLAELREIKDKGLRVKVTDVEIRFWSMVVLMLKIILAALPAMFLASLLGWLLVTAILAFSCRDGFM